MYLCKKCPWRENCDKVSCDLPEEAKTIIQTKMEENKK